MDQMMDRLERKKKSEADKALRESYESKAAWSHNIFKELSANALQDFYLRANKEREDIRAFFNLNEYNEELCFQKSKSPEREAFMELCYLCRVTEDKVNDYLQMLRKRVIDIEN